MSIHTNSVLTSATESVNLRVSFSRLLLRPASLGDRLRPSLLLLLLERLYRWCFLSRDRERERLLLVSERRGEDERCRRLDFAMFGGRGLVSCLRVWVELEVASQPGWKLGVICPVQNSFFIMSAMGLTNHRRRAISAGGRISSERVPLAGFSPARSPVSSQISEADVKYRRWLALSEDQAEKQELMRYRAAGSVPVPKTGMTNSTVRQNKAR